MDASPPSSHGRLTRREVLGGGLFLGAAYLVGGAGGAGTPRSEAGSIPGPITHSSLPKTTPAIPPPQPAPLSSSYQLLPRVAWTNAGVARPRNTQPMGAVAKITIH